MTGGTHPKRKTKKYSEEQLQLFNIQNYPLRYKVAINNSCYRYFDKEN